MVQAEVSHYKMECLQKRFHDTQSFGSQDIRGCFEIQWCKCRYFPNPHRHAQSCKSLAWRLERISGFEMAIYANERTFLANAYDDEPEALRATLIDLQVHRIHEKEFRNLALQESRIRRQRDRDISELRYLQAERKRLIEERLALAAEALKQAKAENKPFDPSEFGFVFSTAEIERFLTLQKLRNNITEGKFRLQTSPRGRSKVA